MELKITESPSFDDGEYAGVIDRVEYGEYGVEKYKYTEFYIKESKTGLELKYSAPTYTSVESKLMKMLAKFTDVKPGAVIDPGKVCTGKAVKFLVMREQKGDKSYARIVDGSIKPIVATERVE